MDAEALVARLQADGLHVAVAESCTGGLLQAAIVGIPGASKVFIGGIVAYADTLKHSLLGVDDALLQSAGSVSASVAEAMAHGARDATGADLAIAVTGLAGPEGGSDAKPVGTVWVAVLGPNHVMNAHRLNLEGDRNAIREQTVAAAIELAGENIAEWEREPST